MTGFFPIMMFGLPAACLAMFHEAPKERRAMVGGLLFSMALTSFLTGVTEPIEYTFMFLAPVLYAIHALLTGLSLAICSALGIHLGFTFSAGAIDYVLNYGLSTKRLDGDSDRPRLWWCTTACSASSSASSTWRRRAVNPHDRRQNRSNRSKAGGFVSPVAGAAVPRAAALYRCAGRRVEPDARGCLHDASASVGGRFREGLGNAN